MLSKESFLIFPFETHPSFNLQNSALHPVSFEAPNCLLRSSMIPPNLYYCRMWRKNYKHHLLSSQGHLDWNFPDHYFLSLILDCFNPSNFCILLYFFVLVSAFKKIKKIGTERAFFFTLILNRSMIPLL